MGISRGRAGAKQVFHKQGGSTLEKRGDQARTGTEAYRFPRVFGDEFGDEFGDSLNFVSKLVTHLVMISVNHCIW